MKKIFFSILLISSLSFSQTTNDDLAKSIINLIDKIGHHETKVYKQVLSETAIVNSSSNARFSGGSTRAGFKINLPLGTNSWFYRVTLLEPNSNYSYPYKSDFFSLVSNNYPFFVNNQTNYGIDFYILDSYSINDFMQTGNENFKYFDKFSRKNTTGFMGSCDIIYDNLWIGIKNPDIKHGLKVIVEVVAIGNFN